MNKPHYFFPKDRTFWLYHCSLLLVLTLLQVTIFILRDHFLVFNLIAQSIGLPLYTLAVLIFRHCYKARNWQRFSMAKLIPLLLSVALLLAVIMVLIILAVLAPFFWTEFLGPEVLAKENRTLVGTLAGFIAGNSVINHSLISVWAFIYIAVTTNRRVKTTEIKNLRLENSLKEAKISSLANQLNPHFLFNSLNNIRFMIYESAEHADEMITAFSEILRYSLTSSEQDKVAIEEELVIVERYIDIVRLQLEGRLDFQLNFSSSCQRCLIPPMSLQMLVENAIKHGIENIKSKSMLSIDITKTKTNTKDLLTIKVSNPVPGAIAISTQGTGTGIKNIKQRLDLLYGEFANLSVESLANNFTVYLIIPMEKMS
jgi:sensor histidine kinase YesM